jgi:MFS family permease
LSTTTVSTEAPQSSVARRDASWNFWWLVIDGFIFSFGFTFISPSSILPVFVTRLTPHNVLAGAVPAIDFVGGALPQLVGARWAAGAARAGGRKRFVLVVATLGRIPMLAPIVATAVWGDREPGIVLTALLVGLGLFRVSEGLVMPAYYDIVGAVIDPSRRARYFSVQQASGAIGGVVAAFAARWLLAELPFPWGFVACFVLGTFFVTFVLVVFAQVCEPPPKDVAWAEVASAGSVVDVPNEAVGDALAQPTWWRQAFGLVIGDDGFRLLFAGRALAAVASMAPAYYAVAAVRRLQATDADGATFGAVMLGSALVGTLIWGIVAGRFRHAILVPIGAVLGIIAAIGASLAPDVTWLLGTFAATGLGSSALGMADTALPLALAERARRSRALYVAVYATLTVPFAVLSPLAGGMLADAYGYEAVNGVAALTYCISGIVGMQLIRRFATHARQTIARG